MKKILPFGTKVVCDSVDMYGYNGRDLHPEPHDVGFLGRIVGNHVDRFNGTYAIEFARDNVPPGTVIAQCDVVDETEDEKFDEVMYVVQAPDGRKLELMEHEIDVLDSVLTPDP